MGLYALTATFDWETRDEYAGPMATKGTGSISEFSRDDDDEVPEVEITAKEACKEKRVKPSMNGCVAKEPKQSGIA